MQQPPPRKVKAPAALKNIHTEQVSKLQSKNQQEIDLLEDIRVFSRQRSLLEKDYAQGLLKLTSQLLKHEFPAQPELISEDEVEQTTAIAVWRQILEETEKMARARLAAGEIYMDKIAESVKPLKANKIQSMKKLIPQITTIQAEVAQAVMEMTKTHKAYCVEETVAFEARQKLSEAEEKLKRKSTGLFQSKTSLQKNCSKLKSRKDHIEVRATASRNEYLLSLAAANAHHIRYYSTDLPDLIKVLDGETDSKIKEYFCLLGRTAVDISSAEVSSFEKIVQEAQKISREYSLQCFLSSNRVFTDLVQYQMDPCHNDPCNTVSADNNAGPNLEKEAKKWASKVVKETKAIRDYSRTLKSLQGLDQVSDSGTDDRAPATQTQDPEVSVEELRQHIRKAETAKFKAEARLEALRAAGINVEEYINNAQETLGTDDFDIPRTSSELSFQAESSGVQSSKPTYTNYDDDDDFDDAFETAADYSENKASDRIFPIKCQALYDFQASNFDELTIVANEELELVGESDGPGWIRARNSSGKMGNIPESYVNYSNNVSTPVVNGPVSVVVSQTTPPATPTTPPLPPQSQTSEPMSPSSVTENQPDKSSSYSSCDLEVQEATKGMIPTPTTEAEWVQALYDYAAQSDEELSFPEGALIKIVSKSVSDVDDGFWKGELNEKIGVFPSILVAEITTNEDCIPPPPVMVTLPSPDEELPPPPVIDWDENSDDIAKQPVDLGSAEQLFKKVRFSNNHMTPTDVLEPKYIINNQLEDSQDEGEESLV
ncbi:protein nervous wreck-like isoform X2 [Gigantopelta aegis]|uniref:protein nervous wreck-like isoform X2 n=1 Tax=Gigantopelta aegis TaxID=1735272 RepID=UPI001B88C14C|nr:protein nervous wreck-like isoform X2 [Gigantopelta aegis]